MDNSMDSGPSEDECIELYEQLSALWEPPVCMQESGFELPESTSEDTRRGESCRSRFKQGEFAVSEDSGHFVAG